ncbi:MAG: ABC transporter ATP-binding protein, partial [Myxococcota bacterium]
MSGRGAALREALLPLGALAVAAAPLAVAELGRGPAEAALGVLAGALTAMALAGEAAPLALGLGAAAAWALMSGTFGPVAAA